ncbi:MAG: hypothetical protein EZS28_014122 [Streblomastix strix]|uniref:Uncharacterized protein n=1 Tax=Streblomastix strix TaxID=222440 RepID=A0A5J4W6F0_9EUKA|nr:MAG: hypothetical protein EZS28_014122 [Streblomastix strix]
MKKVLRQASIHPQSFCVSRQQFFDQPVTQLISERQRFTRTPLGARSNTSCSIAQSCQVNWKITIHKNRLALQINLAATAAPTTAQLARGRVNFNGLNDPQADWTQTMQVCADVIKQSIIQDKHIKLQINYSTAFGQFQLIAICKDNTKLWETSIYAREQAVIAANSLSDECTRNSVSVSSLESIVRGRRHCGIFLDIRVKNYAAGSLNYQIPYDITIA